MLPQAPPRPMGAFAAPLDTLDQPSAVWMPPRYRAWTRPKGLDAAPHGLPAGVHFPIYRKIYLSQCVAESKVYLTSMIDKVRYICHSYV